MQQQHSESSPLEGTIKEFLETEVPEDWNNKSAKQRKDYFQSNIEPISDKAKKYIKRDKICALEVWCECLGGDIRNMKRHNAKEINDILSGLGECERLKAPYKFGCYGSQRGFKIKRNI